MSLRVLHFQNETNASCPDLCGQGYKASFHNHSSAKGPRKKIYHGHLEGKGPRKGEHAAVKVRAVTFYNKNPSRYLRLLLTF